MSEIEDVLRQSIGLEASSIGAATVELAVRARMAQIGAATTDAYLARLRDTPAELGELIESVVVPESWFFRDGAPFTALARWVREQWQPAHPGVTLRALTVPCSTGEEPYSVSMALLGAGLTPGQFTVDAVDISRRALARAQRAVYGANSFRGQALDFRDRHFALTSDGYALAAEVRQPVRFSNGNILAAGFRPGTGRFDVIFCRNLLIYFDRTRQAQAVRALAAMLAPDGLFFVGHAETGIAAAAGFVTADYPMAFAFRKAAAKLADSRDSGFVNKVGMRVRGTPLLPRRASVVQAPLPLSPDSQGVPRRGIPTLLNDRPPVGCLPGAGLDAARALADRGKLDEATRLCEEYLRQHAASADAWLLLGVLCDAAGSQPRAAECYAKTLYLKPDHEEALLQRALLAERTGDAATAAQLRRRIARVQQRAATP